MKKRKLHTDTMQNVGDTFGMLGHRNTKVTSTIAFKFKNHLCALGLSNSLMSHIRLLESENNIICKISL